jgi:hypothetical protein
MGADSARDFPQYASPDVPGQSVRRFLLSRGRKHLEGRVWARRGSAPTRYRPPAKDLDGAEEDATELT